MSNIQCNQIYQYGGNNSKYTDKHYRRRITCTIFMIFNSWFTTYEIIK